MIVAFFQTQLGEGLFGYEIIQEIRGNDSACRLGRVGKTGRCFL